MNRLSAFLICTTVMLTATLLWAQSQSIDEQYSARIREYTTDEQFLNEMVDHLPASDNVPTPMDHFGDIIGAPDTLHYSHEIYGYLRALAAASPRVRIRTIGRTEEDREMLETIVASEETLADLEGHRTSLNRLADPRSLDQEEADSIIRQAKPVYYITVGLHSPETGSPEMVMELAYRLAVGESELIRTIRDNVILVFTLAEPDGRDRVVDSYRYAAATEGVSPGLPYWGRYVAHDNNRDGNNLALALTRNILASFLHWKATVMHDLHESVPYLYTSTGTGPYNEFIDPITIDEWHNLAHEEVTELTRRGMPGVWTHSFYTGWAGNYLIWIANNRNSIGRFYETFGNSLPGTYARTLTSRQTSREWYRPSPPLKKTRWSLRNNTNYMQSGVLIALNYVARHRQRFLENFYLKSKRAVEAGQTEAPYAFVIPYPQKRNEAATALVNLLRQQGLEVHRATEELYWGEEAEEAQEEAHEEAEEAHEEAQGAAQEEAHEEPSGDPDHDPDESAPAGSYIVRLDQPYRTLARILLDLQTFPEGANPPYDDTGWSLPELRQVDTMKVDNKAIFDAAMELVDADVEPEGGLNPAASRYYLLAPTTDDNVTMFRFQLANVAMAAAEEKFVAGEIEYPAGTILIDSEAATESRLETIAVELGLRLVGIDEMPEAATHDLDVPRIGLIHTWVATPQNGGWWRYAFDKLEIPYTYLSEQDLGTSDLSSFDVLIMPGGRANAQTLVRGNSQVGDPLPWQKSELTPNIGIIDQTDDVRRGMGYEGLANLQRFLESGGLFITEGTTAALPIQMGLTRRVSIKTTRNLVARGTVVRTQVIDEKSPITYGYEDALPVYFSQRPVFEVDKKLGGYRVPDWLKDRLWAEEVPRVVMEFARSDLLVSGMLRGDSELSGTPAVIDVPVGRGHVVLFAPRPFWRWGTHGSHALVFNAVLHWNDLRTGWPERPAEDEEETP